MRTYEQFTLDNGIRVIHNHITTSKIIHCGIMLDIGSRDETSANQGIAHFWEHMAFKGTSKRKSFHIINRLEAVGGELNAFTDKEKILFFASVRDAYYERALELLKDITFDSTFPEDQIERERKVILEEMSMYHDDPDDSLQDEFDALIFKNHSLGMNILGTEKTVGSFQRKHFKDFIKSNLDTSRIVFSSVGNIPFEKVVALAQQHLGGIPRKRALQHRKKFNHYKPHELALKRNVKQARCAMGRASYSLQERRRSSFYMLTSILGGAGMNSRLNLALREKHGFVYSIGAQFVPFSDTGLFLISFGTEPTQLKKSVALIKQELDKLKHSPLGTKQLSSAKEQLLGQIAMAEENNVSFMMMMARNLLDLGRVTPLDEIFDRIKETSAATLQELANEMFDESKLSYLIMEPHKNG